MTNKFTKFISILLCAVLVLNTLPVGVLAQDAGMDQPPVVQPPVVQPPVEQPPVVQPPVVQPPVEQPPVEQPPVEQPPVEQPPVEQPPVEQPPVEQPPVEPTPCTHTGGFATCTALAVCTLCGESYGALADHTGGTATCTAQAVCGVCGAPYGELSPEHSYGEDGKCLCGAEKPVAPPAPACTCESTDPGEHAPFCALYVRTGEPCLCRVSCAEEGVNEWCETCYFSGAENCAANGEEMPVPYVCTDTYTVPDYFFQIQVTCSRPGISSIEIDEQYVDFSPATSGPGWRMMVPVYLSNGSAAGVSVPIRDFSGYDYCDYSHTYTAEGDYEITVTVTRAAGVHLESGSVGKTVVQEANCQHGKRTATEYGCLLCDGFEKYEYDPDSQPLPHEFVSISMDGESGARIFCYGCGEKFPVTLKDAAFTYNGASHCEQENVLGDFLQVDMSAAENKAYFLYESPSVAGDTTNVTDAGFTVNVLNFSKNYSIAPAPITISGIAVRDRLYGETGPLELDLTNAQLQGIFGSDDVQLDGSGAAADFAGSGTPAAGIAAVTVSGLKLTGEDAANYRLEMPADITVKILPTVIEAPAGVAELVYTGEAQPLLETPGAACEGAEMIYSSDGAQWSADLPTGTDAKEYTVHYGARAGGVSNTGLGSFTVTIAPASLNGAVVSADTCTYDGTEQEPAVVTAVLNGKTLVKDQDFTVTGYSNNIDVGTAAVTIEGKGNYQGTASGTFRIEPRTIKVAQISPVNGTSAKEYDGTSTSDLQITSSAFVDGDDVAIRIQRAYYTDGSGRAEAADVETAAWIFAETYVLAGNDSGNYTFESSDPLLFPGHITPKPITVTGLGAADKIYDGTTAATVTGAPVATGLLAQHMADIADAAAVFADADTGTNKSVTIGGIKVMDGAGNDVTANYSITTDANITAAIQPKPITVTGITAQQRAYDGTTDIILDITDVQLDGLVEADKDTVTLDVSTARGTVENKRVGSDKAVTVTELALTGQGAGNYSLVQPTGITAKIVYKQLNITGLKAVDRAYDGTLKVMLDTSAAVLEGMVEGDDLSITAMTQTQYSSYMDTPDVGEDKRVTVSGIGLQGMDVENYMMMRPADLTVTITPADLTVGGLTVASKVYDGKTEATVTGTPELNAGNLPVEGLAVNLGTVTASFDDADVGVNKPVILTGITVEDAQGNDLTGNFRILAVAKGTITAAPITVTPAELEKVYGEADPAAFTFTTSDKPDHGEDIGTLVITRAAGENAGTYAFQLDTKDASANYTFTLAADKHSFTIHPYELTDANTTVTVADKIYNGKTVTGLVKVELNPAVGEQTVLVSGTNFTATGAAGLNLGTYTVEITGKGNFSGKVTAAETWKILPPAIISSLGSIDMTTATVDQLEELRLLAQAFNNADEATMAANGWADEKAKVNALLAEAPKALEEAAAAVNTPAIRATEEVAPDNVTLAQKQTLLTAKGEIEAIRNNPSIYSKLGTDQKNKLASQLDNINAALAALAAVENNDTYKSTKKWLTDNAAGFDADQLTLRNEYQAILQQIDMLDGNTKRILMAELGAALKTAEDALYTYRIIAGNGAAWRRGSYSGLTIKANGHVSLFSYLEVDGTPVLPSVYTLTSGSTIVTLKSAYLNTLAYGWHSVRFHYTDGTTQPAYFFVGAYSTNAATGDDFNPALWAGLMGLALVGLAALVILSKRSKKNRK